MSTTLRFVAIPPFHVMIKERILYFGIAGMTGCAAGFLLDHFIYPESEHSLIIPLGITFSIFGLFASTKWFRELCEWIFYMVIDR